MLKKQYPLLFLLLIGMLFTACGQVGAGNSSKNKDSEPKESDNVEQDDQFVEMSEEDIRSILIKNLDAIDAVMLKLHEAHFYTDKHWDIHETVLDPKEDDKDVKQSIEVTKDLLEGLVTKQHLEELVRMKLYDFFRHLEGASLSSSNVTTRFEVLDQSQDYFKVSFLDLETEAGYTIAGTYVVEYEKVNGSWMLDDFEFISAEEKALNLSFEDVKEAYQGRGLNLDYIDEVKLADGTYIVVRNDDFMFGINKKNSIIDFEIEEKTNIVD